MRVPTGLRNWADDVTGRASGVIGAGNMPVNFDAGGGDWQGIDLSWATVGSQRRALKSFHNALLDADGQLQIAWPRGGILRRIGLRPTRLIKFNVSDRSWSTLATANPNPIVELSNGQVYQRNVYPGVHRRIDFANDSLSDGWIFTQAARDLLTTQGPWPGYWLGTVSRVDLSLIPGVHLRDDDGDITPDTIGRLSAKGFRIMDSGDLVLRLAGDVVLCNRDGSPTAIPVRSWLVVIGGNLFFVELFDPIAAAALPTGDISHNLWFGYQDTEVSLTSLENWIQGGVAAPASTGTATSITAKLYSVTKAFDAKCALYLYGDGSSPDFVQGTTERHDIEGDAWFQFDFVSGPTVTASTAYSIVAWSEDEPLDACRIRNGNEGGETWVFQNISYDGWPAEMSGGELSDKAVMIYCTYEEAAVGGPPVGSLALMGAGR